MAMQEQRVGGSQRGMMTTKSECVYILAFYLLWKRRYIDLCTMCDCVGPYTVAAVEMKTRLTALKKLNAKKNKRKREKKEYKIDLQHCECGAERACVRKRKWKNERRSNERNRKIESAASVWVCTAHRGTQQSASRQRAHRTSIYIDGWMVRGRLCRAGGYATPILQWKLCVRAVHHLRVVHTDWAVREFIAQARMKLTMKWNCNLFGWWQWHLKQTPSNCRTFLSHASCQKLRTIKRATMKERTTFVWRTMTTALGGRRGIAENVKGIWIILPKCTNEIELARRANIERCERREHLYANAGGVGDEHSSACKQMEMNLVTSRRCVAERALCIFNSRNARWCCSSFCDKDKNSNSSSFFVIL